MPRRACFAAVWALLISISVGHLTWSQEARSRLNDSAEEGTTEPAEEETDFDSETAVQPTSFFQPQSFVPAPPPRLQAQPLAPNERVPQSDLDRAYGQNGLRTSRIGQVRQRSGSALGYTVPPSDAPLRAATDAGNHVGKNPAAPPVWIQQRNPIVSDSRINGSRVGRVAGSGSYWVPARIDLDTMLNKMDSRSVGNVTVIPGPYSVRLGPDFQFFQVDMLPSPRSDERQYGGSTGFDFKSNGNQWMGRQTVSASDSDWGARLGYIHRTGNDYHTGDGTGIPSSYNSRGFDLALGRDLSADQHLEFHLLRLDQTNVELPGQAFDIDALVTNGYEVEYLVEDTLWFDSVGVSSWYNDTRLHGDAQNSGKRKQFDYFDQVGYVGQTEVNSMSTGYRIEATTEVGSTGEFLVGTDLRFLRQGLDEFSSGQIGVNVFSGNSPIPLSTSANPGLFAQHKMKLFESFQLTAGARADFVATQIIDSPTKLAALGLSNPQKSLTEILGTSDFSQDFLLGSVFLSGEQSLNEDVTGFFGIGHAERPPTLTELYAAQPFMFLLQNGLNAVTGDPLLNPERLWQLDVGVKWNTDRCRGSVRGFHSWIDDYITFRNDGPVVGGGSVQQLDLHYINTKFATLAGADMLAEYDVSDSLTAFATLAYVEGTNHRADGSREPLPMIPPLKSRLGGRLHQAAADPKWGVELSAQVVNAQHRVATSLLENQTSGYTTYDARAFWEPTRRFTIFTGFENFTNKTYRTHFDFKAPTGRQVLQPGFNYYVGCETRY